MKDFQGFDKKSRRLGEKLTSTKINLVNVVKPFWKMPQGNAAWHKTKWNLSYTPDARKFFMSRQANTIS